MKALVLTQINQPLSLQSLAEPAAMPDEVMVRLAYSAINHRDIWIRKGQYAGIVTPVVLGSDGAGYLNGKEVLINPARYWGEDERFQSPRFEILGLPRHGTFAEAVVVSQAQVYPKPPHLNLAEAAALPLAGLTAYRALFSRAKTQPTDRVLITGIGGGVATLAMQMALAHGCQVFVSSSDPAKIAQAVALGAHAGVLYTDADWHKQLKALSGGIDVVIDGSGGAAIGKLLSIVQPGARIAIYGGTAGALNELSPQQLFWKQASILGSTMGSDSDFLAMLDFVNLHRIKPIVSRIFDLDQGNDAFDFVERGNQMGKVILKNA